MWTLEQIGALRAMAAVLWRCFVLAMVALVYWFLIVLWAPDWTYGLQSRWFGLDRHELEVFNYCGIAALKISAFFFFLIPYLAIRWVLWSAKKRSEH